LNVLEGKNMLPSPSNTAIKAYSIVERVLYEPQLSYLRYVIYFVMPYVVQTMILTKFFVPLLLEERAYLIDPKRKPKERRERIVQLVIRIGIAIVLASLGAFLGMHAANKIYDIPMRADLLEYIALIGLFMMNLVAMSLIIARFFKDYVLFLEIYTIISIIILMTSGSAWPQYMMPPIIANAAQILWPFAHVVAPLKMLCLKDSGWSTLMPYLQKELLFTLFWMPVGIGVYAKGSGTGILTTSDVVKESTVKYMIK
jgi:ABC-2 type transport system permease protein